MVQITRRDTLDLTAINNITGGGYYSEVEVGTPGQKMLLHLDTGSSDTWILHKQADLCNSQRLQRTYSTGCTRTFDADESSTYKVVSRNSFDITYLDGKNIKGDYISDTISVNGKKVSNQQLGLAIHTVKGSGLLGLGFSTGLSTRRSYPTVLDNMVSQKLIGRKAFSLWLNDLSSSEGTVLFGGIDTEKYLGSLTTLPLVEDFHSERMTSYSVAMTGVSIEAPDGKVTQAGPQSFNASTVLDSGSTVCLLPDKMTKQIWAKFDVVDAGYGFIDCKWRGADGDNYFIDFEFDGVTIRVPLEEMVLDNLDPIMDQLDGLLPFDNPCMFGIQSNAAFGVTSSGFALLGDTFLRSAYVVYDEINHQVGIAQANINSTRSNIIELRADETALPTATGVATQVSTPAPTRTPTRAAEPNRPEETSIPVTPTPTDLQNGASRSGTARMGSNEVVMMALTSIFAVFGAALLAA
ncbi:aspartic endopeptidase [Colletotrichum karsti]|uniref:Aspartic endopeptidase n=1 Tax=Colletotrichum karsti TaxID=1095194 RepID=A0A9P6LNU7_9PEZI|nr:aspartic endopeptidase [Colletotrichum karsti]KAF9879616.1 aspartic endopeptidase [Colletotrichum karsti]